MRIIKLYKVIATKEAKALSALDVIQNNKRIEEENNTLHCEMLELEEEITDDMNSAAVQISKIKRLKGIVEVQEGQIKDL